MRILYFYVIILFILSCSNKEIKVSLPSSAPSKPVTENYFGKKVYDPYRNLENLQDTAVQKWFKNQSEYQEKIFSKIAGKDSLIKQMKELDSRYSFSIRKTRLTDKGEYFYLKLKEKEDYFKLYYRKTFSSEEELIFNPKDFKPNSKNKYTINYIQPSWSGEHIAVSMSYDGKELSEIIIIDMKTRKRLPAVITNTWASSFLGINWLPDNSGFTYLYFPVSDVNHKEFKKNTESVLYKLGTDPTKRNVIFSGKTHPHLEITAGDFPATKIKSSSDNHIVGYLAGLNNDWTGYYLSIENLKNGILTWKPLITSEDKSYRSTPFFDKDKFIFKSSKEDSNFKIVSIDVLSKNKEHTTLVPAFEDETIKEYRVTKNGLFFTTLKNGVQAKFYHLKDDKIKNIKLPKESGNILLQSISPESDDIWVYINGWANDEERYKYSQEGFIKQNITADSKFPEFDNLIVEEVEVISHDGEKVPLSIVYDKSIKRDGQNPVIIDGYGAYGSNMSPYFSPLILNWVLEGGVFCTSHVRGGGEKGSRWHKAGKKTTKPNTWKDLIACSEYMIKEKYTSKKKLTIFSSSAGGIMIGRAITERPDLFAAAIVQVGVMNPLRNEAMPGEGGANYKEYGSVKDSIEALALIEMDPYLHIKKNTEYPATFLTGGMNDPRVSPWMPGKFVARLQASDTKKPVVFDVQYNEGHHGRNVFIEWANIFSFALWQSGHPDYQTQ